MVMGPVASTTLMLLTYHKSVEFTVFMRPGIAREFSH